MATPEFDIGAPTIVDVEGVVEGFVVEIVDGVVDAEEVADDVMGGDEVMGGITIYAISALLPLDSLLGVWPVE